MDAISYLKYLSGINESESLVKENNIEVRIEGFNPKYFKNAKVDFVEKVIRFDFESDIYNDGNLTPIDLPITLQNGDKNLDITFTTYAYLSVNPVKVLYTFSNISIKNMSVDLSSVAKQSKYDSYGYGSNSEPNNAKVELTYQNLSRTTEKIEVLTSKPTKEVNNKLLCYVIKFVGDTMFTISIPETNLEHFEHSNSSVCPKFNDNQIQLSCDLSQEQFKEIVNKSECVCIQMIDFNDAVLQSWKLRCVEVDDKKDLTINYKKIGTLLD